jgi:DNA-binding response OmpR family regulator
MKILLIEDDENIVDSLIALLKTAGHATETAPDGERGYRFARSGDYDLIIMDYNLPKMDGREITKKIREEKINTPILMLTVRNELDDKVELLNLGVDDYLAKPFAAAELLARLKALSRRPRAWQGHILKNGNLELDPDRFLVTKNGQRIVLSGKEFSLLECLMKHKGRILSRQEIMEKVWDENADPFSNTIEVHIMNLRKKLEERGETIIATISGRGYRIETPTEK